MNQRAAPLFGTFIIGLAVVLASPANLFACVGHACKQDCGSESCSEKPSYQDFSFLGLKEAIAAEKQNALTARKYDTYYELVAPILESFRGPQGFEIGHVQSDVMITRSLPNQFREDGSEAFEPAQSVSVSLEVRMDRMTAELKFTKGLTVSGEILDSGSSGVLRVTKAGPSLSVVSW